ncbi:hypothetical protein BDR04DRAFT_1122220 [Suillus decipiens]|nr:hypothetical protein BDR04DRAFT_1122220 [Suillus decipiens]
MRSYSLVAALSLGSNTEQWRFDEGPPENATRNLIFDTVHSFLQHRPNTRYRNGHNIVPGVIPNGTLIYHGTDRNTIPILYFDGSSAAKMSEGTMDTQDIVAWGEVQPERYLDERQRIKDLWVRIFEVMHSGSWHNRYPGDSRIVLDLTGLVSLYGIALAPSLVSVRAGIERWDHRVLGISSDDIEYSQEVLQRARLTQTQLRVTLAPYLLDSTVVSDAGTSGVEALQWASPIFRLCATTHTSVIINQIPFMTPSEHLVLSAIEETTREVCRVTTKMWAEMCCLPTWPNNAPGRKHPPPTWDPQNITDVSEAKYLTESPPEIKGAFFFFEVPTEEWRKPQPKCISCLLRFTDGYHWWSAEYCGIRVWYKI